MQRVFRAVAIAACFVLLGCEEGASGPSDGGADGGVPSPFAIRINEVVSDDEGTLVDGTGQTEDWIELVNAGAEPVELAGFTINDTTGRPSPLPSLRLPPGARLVLFADEDPEEGPTHLGFKIASDGDGLWLRDGSGRLADAVVVPRLAENQSFARFPDGTGALAVCRWASPGRANGERCGPPPRQELPATVHFAPFSWPAPAAAPKPLAFSEIALHPARFVEVVNTSTEPVDLGGFAVRLAPHAPGVPWPGPAAGAALTWPAARLEPGARAVLPVAADTASTEEVVSLFRLADGGVVDRVDFARWPEGAVLSRSAEDPQRFTYCANATPGVVEGACAAVPARAVGDRLRHIRLDGDFAALAKGGNELGTESVKFIVDMDSGDVVTLLSGAAWALHYTFIREMIEGQPRLDRCKPDEQALFNAGWTEFSLREYFQVDRRYLLGTLVRWAGSPLKTVEFAPGDVITGEQMRRAFFAVTARLPDKAAWAVRPQSPDQIERIRAVEGTLPIVDPNAPFRGLTFQPLVAGETFGLLKFVPVEELATTPLGPDVIVVTDDVPNDVPLVGGLVTEAFQTPLSHVAILSKNRSTPDMALARARQDPRVAPLLDKLVRLEVGPSTFSLREATAEEVEAFQRGRKPTGPRMAPRLDTTVRGVVELAPRSLVDLPSIGAKAAQLAELGVLARSGVACPGGMPIPAKAVAIPVVHGREHFERSGAAALYRHHVAQPAFHADPRVRAQALAEVRAAIERHPVDAALLAQLVGEIDARWGRTRVRLRSSSNTEDLPGFTGAGLYTSVGVAIGDPERSVEDGLRRVWASLWSQRAWDERELALIDHDGAAMGVLVHQAFTVERANGVAVSRNVLDPIDGSAYYLNSQVGEAAVANPAPGVTSEEIVYHWGALEPVTYHGRSSLTVAPVLSRGEIDELMCVMRRIHDHFKARIDPMGMNRWFAVDVEWKLVGPSRQLVVKQARPFSFGRAPVSADCREL